MVLFLDYIVQSPLTILQFFCVVSGIVFGTLYIGACQRRSRGSISKFSINRSLGFRRSCPPHFPSCNVENLDEPEGTENNVILCCTIHRMMFINSNS